MTDLGLIFDRTNADLANETDKAFIDFNDLNRVENAIKQVTAMANELGYYVRTDCKTDWTYRDIRAQEEMDRICKNLKRLKAFITVSPLAPTVNAVTYLNITNANNIERLIYEIQRSIEAMKENMRYSGEVYSGDLWEI